MGLGIKMRLTVFRIDHSDGLALVDNGNCQFGSSRLVVENIPGVKERIFNVFSFLKCGCSTDNPISWSNDNGVFDELAFRVFRAEGGPLDEEFLIIIE